MPSKKKNISAPAAKKQKTAAPVVDDVHDFLDVQQDQLFDDIPLPPIPSEPTDPITSSYTYASLVPSSCSYIDPSNPTVKVPCVLGVDEAGRGPVLGPLVYGIAYCPLSYQEDMKAIGFADSKALTADRRDTLLSALIDDSSHLGWAVRVMSPQDISAGMLRRRPINLNAQSSQATVTLIAAVLESGVDVTEIYVDTVGDPKSYSRLLSSHFPRHPHIKWTVTSKADAIYPIVGAASIAAKVTRDRCIEGWRYAVHLHKRKTVGLNGGESQGLTRVLEDSTNYNNPAPALEQYQQEDSQAEMMKRKSADTHTRADVDVGNVWSNMGTLGSGYPGDPNTVAFLKRTLDPVFGWPGIVRFSWATAKTMLDEKVKPPTFPPPPPPPPSSSSSSSISKTDFSPSETAPSRLGGKRLTRSLSRTSSFTPISNYPTRTITTATTELSIINPPTPSSSSSLHRRPTSMYGTFVPQPNLPGGTASRAYKVKWIDEPVSISKFFDSASIKKSATSAKIQSTQTDASLRAREIDEIASFQVSALQTTVNDWLKTEAHWRTKQAITTTTAVQIKVAKLVKDLGLSSVDGAFCL